MATVHEKLTKELCFICGCILRGTVYDVENKLLGLLPCFFCNICYRTVTMYEGRVENGLQHETGKKPIKWEEHREANCVPCDLYAAVKRGDRKRKIARKGNAETIGIGHPALANSNPKLNEVFKWW